MTDEDQDACPVCGCTIQQCILCGDDYCHGCTTGGDECQACLNAAFDSLPTLEDLGEEEVDADG